MTEHGTGTREKWRAARLALLDGEKAPVLRSDELARMRQELPWVRVDKEYEFDTREGRETLADVFRGRSQLLIYHFMLGPDYISGSTVHRWDATSRAASGSCATTSRAAER